MVKKTERKANPVNKSQVSFSEKGVMKLNMTTPSGADKVKSKVRKLFTRARTWLGNWLNSSALSLGLTFPDKKQVIKRNNKLKMAGREKS